MVSNCVRSLSFAALLVRCVFVTADTNIPFTENKGQVRDQFGNARPDIRYSASKGEFRTYFLNDGLHYHLSMYISWRALKMPTDKKTIRVPAEAVVQRVEMHWEGANPDCNVAGGNAMEGIENFYQPGYPEGILGVKSYHSLTYTDLYEGIDARYYSSGGNMKCDYSVAPFADYTKIRLRFDGANKVEVDDDGSLVVTGPLGSIREERPVAFEDGVELPAKWKVSGNVASFIIEGHNISRSLLIDPVIRMWGTHFGNSGGTSSHFAVPDRDGNVFIGGQAFWNAGGIATIGAFQTTITGQADAYIAKFSPAGIRQWGTYYGGAGNEDFWCAATDAQGSIYAAGYADSLTIVTAQAHQPVFGGMGQDGLLVKFDANGTWQWSTWYGTANQEYITGCATDRFGHVFISGFAQNISAGVASGGTAIASSNGFQTTASGIEISFLAKFSVSGVRKWGTWYGDQFTSAIGCGTDQFGNVFMGGRTGLNSVIATPNCFQPNPAGNNDCFVVKFDSLCQRQWGTYYGGGYDDWPQALAVDRNGNSFMVGGTYAQPWESNGLTTPGCFKGSPQWGAEGWLARFDASGMRTFGTLIGGFNDDSVYDCFADSTGNVVIAGMTNSNDLISVPGAHQTTLSPYAGTDIMEAFMMKFTPGGQRVWGTYYGGSNEEFWPSCSVDRFGNTFLTGNTASHDTLMISTPGSHQEPSFSQSSWYADRAFLAKFADCAKNPSVLNSTTGPDYASCGAVFTLTTTWQPTINWYNSPTSTISIGSGYSFVTPTLAAGVYTYFAQGKGNCQNLMPKTAITVTVTACVGLPEMSEAAMPVIYPNPATDIIHLDGKDSAVLTVFDVSGREVLCRSVSGQDNVDVSGFTGGVYLCRIALANRVVTSKVVIVR